MDKQEALEIYCDLVDLKTADIWEGARNSKEGNRYPWRPYSMTRAKKIWTDYARYGVIRDEKYLDSMAQDFLNKVASIDAITKLSGHTSSPIQSVVEEVGLTYDEKTDDKLTDYIRDEHGTWRISDYGLNFLQSYALDILCAESSEDKLLALDGILNVTHQRSNLASWFIKGGRGVLQEFQEQRV